MFLAQGSKQLAAGRVVVLRDGVWRLSYVIQQNITDDRQLALSSQCRCASQSGACANNGGWDAQYNKDILRLGPCGPGY
jgi:hypothetical protein